MDFHILTVWGCYYEKEGGFICTNTHVDIDKIPERFVHTKDFNW